MSKKPLSRPLLRSLVVLVGISGLIALYFGFMFAADRAPRLNLEVVDKGRLLRTAQPRVGDLEEIYRAEGIGTIISLRGREEREVKIWAKARGVEVITMQMWADDPPTEGQIGLFFDIMRGEIIDTQLYRDVMEMPIDKRVQRPRHIAFPLPVLLHCEGGSDRTGVMVALYRMAFQGWGVKLAQADMTGRHHISCLHPKQFEFLERIEPWLDRRYGSRLPPVRSLLPPTANPPVPTPAQPEPKGSP